MLKSKCSSDACLLFDLSFPCRFTTFTISKLYQISLSLKENHMELPPTAYPPPLDVEQPAPSTYCRSRLVSRGPSRPPCIFSKKSFPSPPPFENHFSSESTYACTERKHFNFKRVIFAKLKKKFEVKVSKKYQTIRKVAC